MSDRYRIPRISQKSIVFISGQDDPIGDFGMGVEKSVAQLSAQGQTDITLKLYAGMRHEINEDCKMEVFQFISSLASSPFSLVSGCNISE
jgi:alpha-beta hydrolase superfamily lysophospholipase